MTAEGYNRQLVLVGGGHSHVQVLADLAENPLDGVDVTVIVDRPRAIYSGMVPGFVAGMYRSSELELDVVALTEAAGARFVHASVERLEADRRQMVLKGGDTVAYDLASINIGSTVAGLHLPGIRDHAMPTRPIADLVREVDELVGGFAPPDGRPYRVVVVGGGAGGTELAFCLDARLRGLGTAVIETVLLTDGTRVLTGYSERLSRRVERSAEKRGIGILTQRRVLAAERDRLQLEGGNDVGFDLLVWVTGAVSHPVFATSGLPTDERGFVLTRSSLQVEGHDDLFAVGDCATLVDFPRTPKAGVYAVRQGPFIARNLRAFLQERPLERYTPQSDFLTLLNLGDGTAVGAKKGLTFQGRWVMKLKDAIDRRFMNRFATG